MARATVTVIVLAALLLLASSSACVTMAARPGPAEAAASGAVDSSPGHHQKATADVAAEAGCEGATDEDDCMARRTLVAHTDYIYTQNHHN